MLNVYKLRVVMVFYYVKCYCAESHYGKCHYVESSYAVSCAECHNAEGHHTVLLCYMLC